ncbi:DUF3800 domain-containing protein [Roseibium suaedae]|uniref:DUF3800 domain-containing protein n=1 Tax=Roseibium suaedae TaxID=735517 RepID=A0A1M7KLC1_9HYPH|nr:DUF3800 domain-containing protein [Roseibium suaedae]SHM66171.1 Protein of unknown function [Roseibium suaedae]
MKFIYFDESGSRDEGDVFVMCGLMVDAYKLRKKTADFDEMFAALLTRHPGSGTELKTKRFINGKGGWRAVPAQERKAFLTDVCRLAVSNGGKLFGIGLSFEAFDAAIDAGYGHPFGNNYWLASSMFSSALVQKKMQGVKNSKGLTVVIMDDNKVDMPKLSDGLYNAEAWYDPLYQIRGRRRGKPIWIDRKPTDRFDHIINTAFAIKSDHSSLVQVADAICYVYRRHLELKTADEIWDGEQEFYQDLVAILEPHRDKLGQAPTASSVSFFKAACHPDWVI